MNDIIDLKSYPIKDVLKLLLKDKTTKKNMIFTTNEYYTEKHPIEEKQYITESIILGFNSCDIQPRVCKSLERQAERTRKNAEVFTPSWICNNMNNHCDAEWFGTDGIFNVESGESWITITGKISFPEGKTWKKYVDSKRLEITCGEAPYIVSRYDASTGEVIEINHRIGILDRKLRVICENAETEEEWLKWVIRAYQSVYGYEFQGDNLLIARINLLVTFVDYMEAKWNRIPTDSELRKITNIICWNIWQMDGITGTIPFGKSVEDNYQFNFFDFIEGEIPKNEIESIDCRIFDWRSNMSIPYKSTRNKK